MWTGRFILIEPHRTISLVLALAFFFLMPEVLTDSRMEKKTEAAHEVSSVRYMACTGCALLFLDNEQAGQKIATEQVVLRIQNMNCRSCPNAVEQSLLKIEGVFDVLITLKPPRAFVLYDRLKVSVEQLTEVTEKAGFPSIADKTAISPEAHTPYIYYAFLPALVLLIVLALIFYVRRKNQAISMYLEPSRNIILKRGEVEK